MSRVSKEIERDDIIHNVVVGFDPPLSEYFIQVFRPDLEDDYEIDPTGEGMILNEATYTTHTSKGDMLDLYEKWEVDQEFIDKLVLDIPF